MKEFRQCSGLVAPARQQQKPFRGTRFEDRPLQRGRTADRVEGHQVQALDPRLKRGNAISGAIHLREETLQADLCPLGSDKGPAAGMAAAALVGSESRLGTGAGQGRAGCRCGRRRMMMAARHAVRGRTHRRSHTVFVCRRHRRRSRQRRERPRKQDQQQQSGSVRPAIPQIQIRRAAQQAP